MARTSEYVPGRNYKSVRIARLKNAMTHYNGTIDKPFTRALAMLREFLTIGTISVRNCQFARKFICERLTPLFQDPSSVQEIAEVELLFIKAEERRERRKANKLARKEAEKAGKVWKPGKPGRPPNSSKPAPTQGTPAAAEDVMKLWESMLEEKKP